MAWTFEKPDNLLELWEEAVSKFGANPLFGTRRPDGTFEWVDYATCGARVDAIRAGLAGLGVVRGDAVGIIANNRLEWALGAFATYGLAARWVPMYESEIPATWRYILQDAGVKVLFVSAKGAEGTDFLQQELPGLVVIRLEGEGPGTLADLEARGRAAPVPSVKPGPEDVAGLIYTSGTTGDPKGVLLTHGNFTSNVIAGQRNVPQLSSTDGALSILPWAHSYAQTGELYNFIKLGGFLGIAGGPTTVAADILQVRPTFLVAVPRLFNRLHDAIRGKVTQAGGLKLKLFNAALAAARLKRETGKAGLKYRVLDKLVFSKVRAGLGGRLGGALNGSARLDTEISYFFLDLGIPVYDCYGLTETSPAVTMNGPGHNRIGTVGRAIDGVRVVIDRSVVEEGATDGEVVVYGPNVMLGYHNKPEATALVKMPDGALRTGDRGWLDEEGYLHLSGRIKEQYKLLNGKYVFPAEIEEALKRVPYVLNAMVSGDGRPWNVGVVVLDLGVLQHHAAGLGLTIPVQTLFEGDGEESRLVRDLLTLHLRNTLKGRFAPYELPRNFLYVTEDFTIENGMLTPTMKLKRRAVLAQYGERIEALYGEGDRTASDVSPA